ncbi:exopolygalacturonate lyase [Vibrio sp. CAIM 722]|uniref:Exopolygalacturonate lyase n=1 Tax=Vibrio eleionomae TaxID=2653505 RepID=A0A7X4LHF1_9VIBR|nr:right-handed parallel beta-helix repeat-containing protein [Vibrio eleionomae]MZI91952.1 exopolygalacturonate lyase [Vibrio eleionomae]
MKKNRLALSIAAVLAVGGCASQSADMMSDSQNLTWQAITFGQSTDLNFGSTILPNKVGTNQVTVDGKLVQPGPVAKKFTVESRGGKLANSHEGGTFYYTKLPTNVNFILSADVQLDQLGPETGSTPNRQEGAGIMVRDIIGKARMNPQPEGQEEFPAASNMVMNIFRAHKKGVKGLVNVDANFREGIYKPWGTAGNRMSRDEYVKGITYGPDKTYHMTLTRNDKGYVVSYSNGTMTKTVPLAGAHANIVEMQDPDHQYVGFFASRNAKMTVSNVQLTLSPAHTENAPRYHAKLVAPVLQQASPDMTPVDDYTVQARANYTGKFGVQQNGKWLVKDQLVSAGEMFDYNTSLTAAKAKFDVSFTPIEGPDLKTMSYHYTVTKKPLSGPHTLVVNPKGTHGHLTLQQAVNILPPGGTILLEDGDYPALTIPVSASGTPEHVKTLKAKGNHVRFVGTYLHDANYWKVSHIEVAGARTIVSGSHNEFEYMRTHNAPDSGFQISSPSDVGRALWASYNTVTDSESYNNMDKSQINADGFAVKMRVGDGNTLIRCVSHHNIDDGFDLFNKVEDGPDGAVTILDSVAYMNGETTTVKAKGGTRGNGFKLGGEGLPVAHIVKNSLAFHNNMDGFTDNFNPGSLVVENNVSIDNKRFNYLFRKSPYTSSVKQGTFEHDQSYRFYVPSKYSDVVNGEHFVDNRFVKGGVTLDAQGHPVTGAWVQRLKKAARVNPKAAVPGQQAIQDIREFIYHD